MLQYKFYCFYYSNTGGTGKTGLTVTAKVRDSSNNLVYSGSATEIGEGWYKYFYSTATDDFYTCTFSTTDTTVLVKDLPSLVGYPILYIDRKSSTLATPGDIPSAATIAGATDTQLTSTHGSGSWVNTENPTVAQIDAQLSSTHGSGLWGGGATGSVRFEYPVIDSTTGFGIADVRVTVALDANMANVVDSKMTDENGLCVFYLDPGTYYFFAAHSGYSFDNPDIEEVV